MSAYLPIAEHGVIGDSHSVFAAILDAEKGGFYRISPVNGGYTVRQLYFPDTNGLITRFLTPDGVGEVHDFMPIQRDPRHARRLVRQVVAVRGEMRFALECRPRFDYARQPHELELYDGGAVFNTPALSLTLATNVPLERHGDDVTAQFDIDTGATATFVLQPNTRGQKLRPITEGAAAESFESTVRFWRGWLAHSVYKGRWREMVNRSALTLKLLTYRPTGAIVAAPTTSLPEHIGGERNWDYRYTWIRDA